MAAAFAAVAARGVAEPRPIDARVVWAHGDRIYIAAADSVALAAGDLVILRRGKKTIASGEIAEVLARDLAAARITSGSLSRESHLDRVRILADRLPLPRMPVLHVGYPRRATLLFDCGRAPPHLPFHADLYRTDSLAENSFRLVRGPGVESDTLWPDTIFVQLFAEVADEEIALERGELDFAVFWSGEASTRLRADRRWQHGIFDAEFGGVLAAIEPEPGSRAPAGASLSPADPPLAALNREMFRGDLLAWGWAKPHSPATGPAQPAPGPRFVVDASCPGRAVIERFLERETPAAESRDRPLVRLFYVRFAGARGSFLSLYRETSRHIRNGPYSPELRAKADTLDTLLVHLGLDPRDPEPVRSYTRDSLHVTFLFSVGRALAFDPALRPYLNALRLDALADMVDCPPADRTP